MRLDTVPARIRADQLPIACDIAEFILNVLPMTDPPQWSDVEKYVATRFVRPDGGYEFSCDQDFLRVERLARAQAEERAADAANVETV